MDILRTNGEKGRREDEKKKGEIRRSVATAKRISGTMQISPCAGKETRENFVYCII